MALKNVRINITDVELTDDNTEIDEWGLGFIGAKCRHCGASLHLSEDGVVVCLNFCYLPAGVVRRLSFWKE